MKSKLITTVSLACLAVILIIGITLSGCATAQNNGKTLFIAGSYGALSRGVYDGEMTIADLKRNGDFAVGTFSGIDGELLGLNGKYYQIGTQGKINPVDDAWTTPYATVTFFNSDKMISIDKPLGYQELQGYLNSQLPTPNVFYAMKISGTFDSIKARSLTKLTKPYPSTPYSTITQNEPTFEFRNVGSTLVVFVSPSYTGEISYPGYHAHFMNNDGKYGGHMLDCRITSGKVEVDIPPNFNVNLPQNNEFYKLDFTKPK